MNIVELSFPERTAAKQETEGRPSKLRRRLKGDLDNIVLKALRKEPERRYTSVEQLAEDIRRHLKGLPVTAVPDSPSYRAGKFVRRHKAGVAATAIIAVAVAGGVAATVREARVAEKERQRAERRFNDVRQLSNSLIFEIHDSIRQVPGATATRKLIVERGQQYLDVLAQESQSDPSLLRELAVAYGKLASVQGSSQDANLGDTSKAIQNFRKAVTLMTTCVSVEPHNPENQRMLGRAYQTLAMAIYKTGDQTGSKELTEKAVEILEPLAKAYPADQKIRYELGSAYQETGQFMAARYDLGPAVEFYEKALAVFQQGLALDPGNHDFLMQISFAHKHLAAVLEVQNQLPEALDHERTALAIDEGQLSRDPENTQARYNITYTYSDTASILAKQGDLEGALQYYGKSLELRSAMVAADPQDTRAREGVSNNYFYLGGIFLEKENFVRAIDDYKKSFALREALSLKDPANEGLRLKVAESEIGMGRTYARKAAQPHEQLSSCREALLWMRKALPTMQQWKAENKLMGEDADLFAVLSREIDNCSRTIAHLSRSTDPH